MKILYIIALIASIANCLGNIYLHNIYAALGWGCSCIWLIVLIMEEYKDN